ncbi:hypothetical protein SeMB42_g06440 [Synchytrium endobioticum]|uniref:Retrovirus-related Pol polyprotein from transposon TNT 1-94-like beta-barrel domain-containing protein n=1 Tax=Synchytrium endobioticum TaxID=286115 RepID=A0A507CC92_9FUNG|nr:hypothetical protein SeMB42_g06440 [Synchytrium endobioticum]
MAYQWPDKEAIDGVHHVDLAEDAFVGDNHSGSSTWILDPGCTHHMTDDVTLFQIMKPLQRPVTINGIGTSTLTATSHGTIEGTITTDSHNPSYNYRKKRRLVSYSQIKIVPLFKEECLVASSEINLHNRYGHVTSLECLRTELRLLSVTEKGRLAVSRAEVKYPTLKTSSQEGEKFLVLKK